MTSQRSPCTNDRPRACSDSIPTHVTIRNPSMHRNFSEGTIRDVSHLEGQNDGDSSCDSNALNDDTEWSTSFSSLSPTRSENNHSWRQMMFGPIQDDSHWSWRVTADSLRPVPSCHPLEHSSITLTDIPVPIISARISNYIRINSISSSYHTDRVDCLTLNLLKFVVQLWRVPDETGPPHGVILELQRRQGCTIEMRQVRRALFHAVVSGEESVTTGFCGLERMSCHAFPCPTTPTPPPDCRVECDAFAISRHLLESSHMDQNRLGMESMDVLTNPSIVNRRDAETLSRALVFGDGSHGQSLRDSIIQYFIHTERDTDSYNEFNYDSDDADDSTMNYAQGCHFGTMHTLALRVLSNALEAVTKQDNQKKLSKEDLGSSFWRTILEALVYNIEVASYRPQEAARSAKCLCLLAQLAPEISNFRIIEDRLLPVLTEANEYGRLRHLSLERESQSLMGCLAQAH